MFQSVIDKVLDNQNRAFDKWLSDMGIDERNAKDYHLEFQQNNTGIGGTYRLRRIGPVVGELQLTATVVLPN